MSTASEASLPSTGSDHPHPVVDPVDTLAESGDLGLRITPGDKLFPVATAFEERTGNRPHPTTTCRLCRKGSAGILLPSLICNGRRMTSLEALDQWLRDVTVIRDAS